MRDRLEGGRWPTFLYVGPDKSGSTWLYELCKRHPEIYVPEAKDIYYFDRYYYRDDAWYISFFTGVDDRHRAWGEICHDYLFSPVAAARIRRKIPGVTLTAILRNPVERAQSHYLFLRRSGLTSKGFWDAAADWPHLLTNGLYARHLQSYLDTFPARQLSILWFEDLQADRFSFAGQITEIFGVSSLPAEDVPGPTRVAARARSMVVARIVRRGGSFVRDLGMPGVVGRLKHSQIVNRLLFQRLRADERLRLTRDDRLRLVAYYEDDIEALQRLFLRNLSGWRTARGESDSAEMK